MAYRAQALTALVVMADASATDLPVSRRTAGLLAFLPTLFPSGLTLPRFHRRHHAVQRHGQHRRTNDGMGGYVADQVLKLMLRNAAAQIGYLLI